MSIFANAKKVDAKPTAAAKKSKQEIAIKGIERLSEMKAMIQSLEAAAKTIEGEVKDLGFAEFLKMDTKTRPESFKGTEGFASCSVEMRKRGTNSALNLDEVEVLENLGLKAFTQVVTTEMFGINPAYAANEKLMGLVSDALKDIVPDDFIVLQAGVTKSVVDDSLCDAAFQLPSTTKEEQAKRAKALAIVTTMALKPKLNADYPMEALQTNVASYLKPEESEVSEATAEKLTAEAVAILEAPKKTRAKKAAVAA